MNKLLLVLGIVVVGLLGTAGFTALWGVGTYNSVVTKKEEASKAISQVDNVYQRRFDLIPNIVETVKGEAAFERGTLEAVAKARASVGQFKIDQSVINDPAQFAKFQESQGILGSALNRLMVIQEKYPDLKANASFQHLMVELEGTENRIAVERRGYNEAAQDYNRTIKVFPGSIVASYTGFKELPYFTADAGSKTAPKVSFK